MNSQQHVHKLRVQLLAMSRLAQRVLDYSVKGYQTRNLDFCLHVRTAHGEFEERHRRMRDLSRELINGKITDSCEMRFVFAALTIAAALRRVYTAAAEIGQDTARLLESSGIQRCAALEKVGQSLNGFVRLCIIALFEKESGHADAVLRNLEVVRFFHELTCVDSHPHIGRWAGAQGDFERAVSRNLGEVAKHAHEIADAILFWLEGKTSTPQSAAKERIVLELPAQRQQPDAATLTLSYVRSGSGQTAKLAQSPC